jgi:hypothetical protein
MPSIRVEMELVLAPPTTAPSNNLGRLRGIGVLQADDFKVRAPRSLPAATCAPAHFQVVLCTTSLLPITEILIRTSFCGSSAGVCLPCSKSGSMQLCALARTKHLVQVDANYRSKLAKLFWQLRSGIHDVKAFLMWRSCPASSFQLPVARGCRIGSQ